MKLCFNVPIHPCSKPTLLLLILGPNIAFVGNTSIELLTLVKHWLDTGNICNAINVTITEIKCSILYIKYFLPIQTIVA